jgi:hypothetical protein
MYRKTYRRKKCESKVSRLRANQRAAKERKRIAEACHWRDVGGFTTDGILGNHKVRLLAKDDEDKWLAVFVDGQAKQPRTMRGIKNCIADMIWGKMK